jgi:hypothetical protein
MTPEQAEAKSSSTLAAVYRFLGSAALGTFLMVILMSYGTSMPWSLAQVGVLSLPVVGCGVLAVVWGQQFIDAVMQTLNNAGF